MPERGDEDGVGDAAKSAQQKTEISGIPDETAVPTADRPRTSAVPEGCAAQIAIGVRFGQYDIEAKLGQGGMGAVYKARHVRLDKHVAIKVLPSELTRDAR
jgi:serine/threonine-protein kinase